MYYCWNSEESIRISSYGVTSFPRTSLFRRRSHQSFPFLLLQIVSIPNCKDKKEVKPACKLHRNMESESDSSSKDKESQAPKLRITDWIWLGLAVGTFTFVFLIILIYNVI